MSSLVIVTPILNEKNNITALAGQLSKSTVHPTAWVIVDDGSSDGGADMVEKMRLPFPTFVIRRKNGGNLIGGSAFTAWQHGVDYVHEQGICFDRIMKLDADVELPATYLDKVLNAFGPEIGLVGGVLVGRGNREQSLHVPGPVKLYSRQGYEALANVPRMVGFDVVDELAIKRAGLSVSVLKNITFSVRRPIGASQGLVHGRRRNGQVCRWTGYWPPYFILHVLRYVGRKPYFIGAMAMVYGYFKAPKSPYPPELRKMHADEQIDKIRAALRSPFGWFKSTYGQ